MNDKINQKFNETKSVILGCIHGLHNGFYNLNGAIEDANKAMDEFFKTIEKNKINISNEDLNTELEKRSIIQYNDDDDNQPHWDEDLLKRTRQAFIDGAKWGSKQ
ncbi:MAG: hypothetical protein ACOCUI_04430 [bacterium]